MLRHNLKYFIPAFIVLGLTVALVAWAAPIATYQPTILPQSDNNFDLGTSTNAWRNIYSHNLTVTGTCIGCGAGSVFPFTPQSYGNSTSTVLGFLAGLFSNGSTTISSLTSGLVGNNGGLLYGFASSTLFGYTPLNPTRLINTTAPLQGGGDLSADRTLSITQSGSGTNGYLSSIDWSTFNNKISSTSLSTAAPLTYNSTTGAIGTSFSTSTLNIFTGSNTFNSQTNFLGPLVIGTSTASTTIWGAAATSTFASGISLSNGGCFAVAGVCLTAGFLGGGATEAANWATTAVLAGTPTYNNGTGGTGATLTEVGNGALSVDSNAPATGDRVLVKNQASAFQNGIYSVTNAGSAIAVYILTRATDYNTPTEITPGISTYVLNGTANTNTSWSVNYTTPLTIGTTNLTYTESAAGGTVTSVAASVPSFLSITGSPITTSGTLAISYSGTALPVGNGGTGQTSFTSSGNGIYWNGTSLLTAPLTSAVTYPYASTTAITASGSAWFAASGGSVGIATTSPSSLLQLFSTGTTTLSMDSNSVSKGSCIEMKDMDGSGYTYIYANNGTLYSSTVSCK